MGEPTAAPAWAEQPLAELRDGFGYRVAWAPEGRRWASSDGAGLNLFNDTTYERRVAVPGGLTDWLRFDRRGSRVLLAPWIFDLESGEEGAWEALSPVGPSLSHGLDDPGASGFFELRASAWSPEGDELVAYTGYRPSRRPGATGSYAGPRQRLLAVQSPRREGVDVLWEGERLDAIRAIALTDDLIVAGGETLSVWSRASRAPIAQLPGHRHSALDLAFSADGTRLASAGADGQLILWDTAGLKQAGAWEVLPDELGSVAFWPGQPYLVTGGADGRVCSWSYSGELVQAQTFGGAVVGLAFSPDARRLVAAVSGVDARLVVLNLG